MDSDEEMGPKSVSSGDSEAVRVSLCSISRLSMLLTSSLLHFLFTSGRETNYKLAVKLTLGPKLVVGPPLRWFITEIVHLKISANHFPDVS